MKKVIIFFVGITVLTLSCQSSKQTQLQLFEEKNKSAEELIVKKDFKNSEHLYLESLKIAENLNWTDGIVMSYRNLGLLYGFQKDYGKSEQFLNEAKSICIIKSDCSVGQFSSTYDFIIVLYLFQLKDIDKAGNFINEMILLPSKFGGKDKMKNKLKETADDMRLADFNEQSIKLLNQINQI